MLRYSLCPTVHSVWGCAKDVCGQSWGLCEVQEDIVMDMKIGAKHDWKYSWAKEDVPTMHCYGEARYHFFISQLLCTCC